jgi:hypothetical protein
MNDDMNQGGAGDNPVGGVGDQPAADMPAAEEHHDMPEVPAVEPGVAPDAGEPVAGPEMGGEPTAGPDMGEPVAGGDMGGGMPAPEAPAEQTPGESGGQM